MSLKYDKPHDILYIDIGNPCAAYSDEIDDGVYLRINPVNQVPVGLTIFSFKRRQRNELTSKINLPIDWNKIYLQMQ
jgi:uncharacterized protein YuzE